MKIKSSTKLQTLDGKALKGTDNKDFTLGEALSTILISAQEGGKMKMFVLAQKFYDGKDVEIDAVDLGLVKKAVETDKSFNNLVNGQVLVMLSEVK